MTNHQFHLSLPRLQLQVHFLNINSLLQKGNLSIREVTGFALRADSDLGTELGLGSGLTAPPSDLFSPRKWKIKGLGKYTKNKGQFSLPEHSHLVLVSFLPLILLLLWTETWNGRSDTRKPGQGAGGDTAIPPV